jgi:hypothetical protein
MFRLSFLVRFRFEVSLGAGIIGAPFSPFFWGVVFGGFNFLERFDVAIFFNFCCGVF